jgi:hypothetical protein
MFSPQRKIYGQAYGGSAGRSMSPTTAPASSAYASTRAPQRFGAGFFNRNTQNAQSPGATTAPVAPTAGTNPYSPGTSEYYMWNLYNKGGSDPTKEGNAAGVSTGALNQLIGAGMLNPMGSQSVIDALYGQARGDANALRARSNTLSQLSGMDPAQAASSYFQRDMASEGEIQRMLLNARLQSMTQNRAYLESLANQGQAAKWQDWLDNQYKSRGQITRPVGG